MARTKEDLLNKSKNNSPAKAVTNNNAFEATKFQDDLNKSKAEETVGNEINKRNEQVEISEAAISETGDKSRADNQEVNNLASKGVNDQAQIKPKSTEEVLFEILKNCEAEYSVNNFNEEQVFNIMRANTKNMNAIAEGKEEPIPMKEFANPQIESENSDLLLGLNLDKQDNLKLISELTSGNLEKNDLIGIGKMLEAFDKDEVSKMLEGPSIKNQIEKGIDLAITKIKEISRAAIDLTNSEPSLGEEISHAKDAMQLDLIKAGPARTAPELSDLSK